MGSWGYDAHTILHGKASTEPSVKSSSLFDALITLLCAPAISAIVFVGC